MTTTPSFKGLVIDPAIIIAQVYAQCETGTCKADATKGYDPCDICAKRNHAVAFALHAGFEIKAYVPPRLFQIIYQDYPVRPVTTIDIIGLYMSAIQYLDILFSPDLDFFKGEWDDQAYGMRQEAQGMWKAVPEFSSTLVEFTEKESNKDNLLGFIQLLERRICLGKAIVDYLNNRAGKDDSLREWERVAQSEFSMIGSIRMVEWIHRCKEEANTMTDLVSKWEMRRRSIKAMIEGKIYQEILLAQSLDQLSIKEAEEKEKEKGENNTASEDMDV
jgi:hypothetical protein